MAIGIPGNIYETQSNDLVGTHKAGVIYNTSEEKVGSYRDGNITGEAVGAGANGTYARGVIYNHYGDKAGSYRNGNIYNKEGMKVGIYTGDEEGGAAGGYLLILTADGQ